MNPDVARKIVEGQLAESSRLIAELGASHAAFMVDGATLIETCLKNGGRFFTCGNGGGAADAQHIACELSGKFYLNRPGLAAVALTVNTSALTAIGNDFDYADVFSRQLEGAARKGDVLLGITTSGGSANVVRAVEQARKQGVHVIGFTGARGGAFAEGCDLALVVPHEDTARIQESHICAGHLICQLVEAELFGERA